MTEYMVFLRIIEPNDDKKLLWLMTLVDYKNLQIRSFSTCNPAHRLHSYLFGIWTTYGTKLLFYSIQQNPYL